MKLLSYNIYCVKDTPAPIPNWDTRQHHLSLILDRLLSDPEIKVCCFQEVNDSNLKTLTDVLTPHHFLIAGKFPMQTQASPQYNLIALKNAGINLKSIYCLPHGHDSEYVALEHQKIDYDMSDYRTTVFVHFSYTGKDYLIGNIHTDYISPTGKIAGTVKSLNYLDQIPSDYKILVGDMNMVCHMSEAYSILQQNDRYTILSRSQNFDPSDYSWHGYGTKEPVNVDFAFIEKSKANLYDYQIIKQANLSDEGSDHRPIIITIQQ